MCIKHRNFQDYPSGIGAIKKSKAPFLAHLLTRFVSRLDICICLFHNQTAILSGHVQAFNARQLGITAPEKGARAFVTRVFPQDEITMMVMN
jgi:hypothetical protein